MRILVVEDEPRLARLVCALLESHDYDTTVLHRGEEVLGALRRPDVDLVLLDVVLPGLTGFDILAQARRALPDPDSTPPIIMLTAKAHPDDISRGLDLGAVDYLTKPFEPRDLLARIHAALASRRRRADVPETAAEEAGAADLYEAAAVRDAAAPPRTARLAAFVGMRNASFISVEAAAACGAAERSTGVSSALEAFLARVLARIKGGGGRVERFGEAVDGVFASAPGTSRHALDALDTALSVRDSLPARAEIAGPGVGAGAGAGAAQTLILRIGVTSGRVDFSATDRQHPGTARELRALAMAAHELRAACPPQGILLCWDTARLAHDDFELEPFSALTLATRPTASLTYLLLRKQ